jgi:hypothetical protein
MGGHADVQAGANCFRRFPCLAKNLCDFDVPEASLAAISRGPIHQAGTYSFRPSGIHSTLAGIHADASPWKCLAVVPGHPW